MQQICHFTLQIDFYYHTLNNYLFNSQYKYFSYNWHKKISSTLKIGSFIEAIL